MEWYAGKAEIRDYLKAVNKNMKGSYENCGILPKYSNSVLLIRGKGSRVYTLSAGPVSELLYSSLQICQSCEHL